jgi:hypothetical protein
VPDTLKSAKNDRTVPVTGWLGDRMRDDSDNTDPRAIMAEPSTRRLAPPWPADAIMVRASIFRNMQIICIVHASVGSRYTEPSEILIERCPSVFYRHH